MDKTFILTIIQYAVPLVGALAGLLKKFGPSFFNLRGARKRRMVEDYELMAAFMRVPLENRSRVEVEQAFSAWQRQSMRYQDITALLRFANPSVAFRLYKSAAPFVQLENDGHFVYRKKYAASGRRAHRVWFGAGVYFVFAVVALAPLLMLRPTQSIPSAWWVIAVAATVVFGYFAWCALDYAGRLKSSEHFIKEQQQTECWVSDDKKQSETVADSLAGVSD